MTEMSKLFAALYLDPEMSDPGELEEAHEIIARAQTMSAAERDTLCCAFEKGPLFDGDVPSKSARTQLVQEGYMAKVIVKGEDGFNACTYKGQGAYRVLKAIAR